MDAEQRRAALLLGAEAERRVAEALVGAGWEILDRNWHALGGELDLVARHGRRLRFVEVKARHDADPLADEAVTPVKRRRLVGAAEVWLHAHPAVAWDEVAFLVAWVDTTEVPWAVRWLDDAFDAGG